MEQDCGALAGFGFVGEDGDVAVGVEAVNDAGAGADADAEALGVDGHATVGADLEQGALAPDVRPPRAARSGAQSIAVFAQGGPGSGVGGAPEFAVDFVGVPVTPQFGQELVAGFGRGDAFRGEERR